MAAAFPAPGNATVRTTAVMDRTRETSVLRKHVLTFSSHVKDLATAFPKAGNVMGIMIALTTQMKKIVLPSLAQAPSSNAQI